MRIDAEGVGLEVDVHGAGRPVVLLHGFPDDRSLWRHQVPALVDAGLRVVVPDQRGFGTSDRPEEADAYVLPRLVGDVVAVLDHLGIERAHVVGHDWGAAVAWVMAAFAPERVDHLVTVSVGHPGAFSAAGLPQREKSWYMLLFQFEGVAEQWLTTDGCANFHEWARHPEPAAAGARLSDPALLRSMLAWYRANMAPATLVAPAVEVPPVAAPTMGVWSTGDMALVEENMTGSAAFVEGPWRYERVDGGHWVPLEAPDRLNELLVDFLPAG